MGEEAFALILKRPGWGAGSSLGLGMWKVKSFDVM